MVNSILFAVRRALATIRTFQRLSGVEEASPVTATECLVVSGDICLVGGALRVAWMMAMSS